MRLQLTPPAPVPAGGTVRRRLMAASCALLGAGAARSEQPATPGNGLLDGVSFDSALAYYHEDGRIQAIEPVVKLAKLFGNGQTLSVDATFDSLTGSSPNGALTSHRVQSFTSPSGRAGHRYTTAPGQLPADPNYEDARFAVGANWGVPLTRVTQVSLGGKISVEDDFLSATVNASAAHDFNEKNTTLSASLFDEFDSVRPIGGAPAPGSDYALAEKTGDKTKDGVGVVLGITQVMTRTWLTEVNLSVDRFEGYLNDPYKFISVLDVAGDTVGYRYESRPDQRVRKSAYWENRVAFDQASAALSLRYMSDDWQIRSDTAQLRVHWPIAGDQRYVEPSVRWYRQTAAGFYTPWILDTVRQDGAYESSDSRLGAFHALTYGLKYAERVAQLGPFNNSEFNVRLQYYQQTYTGTSTALSALQGLDLQPGLKAILLQVGWRF